MAEGNSNTEQPISPQQSSENKLSVRRRITNMFKREAPKNPAHMNTQETSGPFDEKFFMEKVKEEVDRRVDNRLRELGIKPTVESEAVAATGLVEVDQAQTDQGVADEAKPELNPLQKEMQGIMGIIEQRNHEPGGGSIPSFGEGDEKIYVMPQSDVTYAPRSDGTGPSSEWGTNQFLVVTKDGFKVIETERSDGGFKAYGEIRKILSDKMKTADNYGNYPLPTTVADVRHGIVDRMGGARVGGKGTVVIGGDLSDSRANIAINGNNEYSVYGDFALKGARVFDVDAANESKLAEGLQRNIKYYKDIVSPKPEAPQVTSPINTRFE